MFAKKELISPVLSAYLAIWQKMSYNPLYPAFCGLFTFLNEHNSILLPLWPFNHQSWCSGTHCIQFLRFGLRLGILSISKMSTKFQAMVFKNPNNIFLFLFKWMDPFMYKKVLVRRCYKNIQSSVIIIEQICLPPWGYVDQFFRMF